MRTKNPLEMKEYVDKWVGYCPYCAVRFDYDYRHTKFCVDKCRWKFNSAVKRDRYLWKMSIIGLPLERKWCLWARSVLENFFSERGYNYQTDVYTEIKDQEIIHALDLLDYPPFFKKGILSNRMVVAILLRDR